MYTDKKILFVATVVKTHINVFHLPYLKLFKERGYITFVCARNDFSNPKDCIIPFCDHFIDTPFSRTPLSIDNVKAYFILKNVILNNNFQIIHCHTPVGGAITRLIVRKIKNTNTRILYTAHGFHFFKGAPIWNWIIYYPIEKWLSKYTDTLITINKEDFNYAQKFYSNEVCLIDGVGIDIKKYSNRKINISKKRKELHLKDSDIILLSVGELIKRKNHKIVIEAISKIKNPNIKYLICGSGKLEYELQTLVKKLNLEQQVFLLGFRNDIFEICSISDIFIFPSLQEGLPVALMESMACCLPVIASNIRGNRDLIHERKGGLLIPPTSEYYLRSAILYLVHNKILQKKMGNYNHEIIKNYSLEHSMKQMERIYFKDIKEE